MSETNYKKSTKFKKGHPYHPRSEEARKRMVLFMSSDKNPMKRPEQRLRNSIAKKGNKGRLGQPLSEEHKKKLSLVHKGSKKPWVRNLPHMFKKGHKAKNGENHYNWKGGVTPINVKIRHSLEYKLWRKAVFERDHFTCIWCGKKGYLEADHIKPFAYFPELRFSIDNGRTLCNNCHNTTKNGRSTR